jgi:primosomal protein N' (replication factor Y)
LHPPGSPYGIKVAVDAPQHTGLAAPLDYLSERPLAPGTLVHVPFGRREAPGIVWDGGSPPDAGIELRPVTAALDALPPLGAAWRRLVDFTAAYYQRSTGEIALSVLPPELRKLDDAQLANRIKKLHKALAGAAASPPSDPGAAARGPSESGPSAPSRDPGGRGAAAPPLTEAQSGALAQIAALAADETPGALLLHGGTGRGKTEVYLGAAAGGLAGGRQGLVGGAE